MQITIDGNQETHNIIRNQNGKPSFDRIISNIIDFCSYSDKNKVLLRINYTNESLKFNYGELLNIIPINVRDQITIDFQRVWQTYDNETDTESNRIVLQQNKKQIIQEKFKLSKDLLFTLHKGCVCYADRVNYANINYDGNVYKCTAKDYQKDNSLGVIDESGDIIWKDENMTKVDNLPFFDNPKCLECHYLAICGGPCLSRKQNMQKGYCFCDIDKFDLSVEQFVNEYYDSTIAKIKQ